MTLRRLAVLALLVLGTDRAEAQRRVVPEPRSRPRRARVVPAPPPVVRTVAPPAAAAATPVVPQALTVTLVNNGLASCVVDAGEAQREIVIMSGTDRIWSSRDCAAGTALTRELLLARGAPDTTTVQWQRKRRSP